MAQTTQPHSQLWHGPDAVRLVWQLHVKRSPDTAKLLTCIHVLCCMHKVYNMFWLKLPLEFGKSILSWAAILWDEVPFTDNCNYNTIVSRICLRGGRGAYYVGSDIYLVCIPSFAPIAMATSFKIESSIRGHHVYKSWWTPVSGEDLCVQVEEDNTFDEFAVAVPKDGTIVGHIPRKLLRTCWYFLKKQHSAMSCIVTEHSKLSEITRKALVVLCVYIFQDKTKHLLDELIAIFI